MKHLRAVLASIWSLFVDDAVFAALIVGWLVLIDLSAHSGLDPAWRGALLFAGLSSILVLGAWRKTRSR